MDWPFVAFCRKPKLKTNLKLVQKLSSCRTGGVSSVFGSEGKVVNIESWRCVHTLRGHSGGTEPTRFLTYNGLFTFAEAD